jgi:Family of unknown function (DUF5683)
MRSYFFYIFLFFPLFSLPTHAQTDSARVVGKTIDSLKKSTHSASRAALYSAVLPGLGQLYNKKNAYWKVPLLYVGAGVIGYFIRYNNNEHLTFRDSYYAQLADKPEHDPFRGRLTLENARRLQKEWGRNRDLVILVALGAYGLNVLDAFVEGHLKTFNVDDNISFRLSPYGENVGGQSLAGLSLKVRFR